MDREELAVVVGASGAFGSVMTERLIEAGLEVLAIGRDRNKLKAMVGRHGDAVRICDTDISHDDSIGAIQTAIEKNAKPVRMVVHGPGVLVAGGIVSAPTEAIIKSVDIKVGGLLRLVRAAEASFVQDSRIVAIAGHYGLEPSQYAAAAGVANAALFSAVRQLSLAYGARGVTAHTIAPGPADTERLRRVAVDRAKLNGTTPEQVLESMRAESSIRRLTTPGQVAWAVTTLLAPEATAMTGSTLMLDSGRRKGLP